MKRTGKPGKSGGSRKSGSGADTRMLETPRTHAVPLRQDPLAALLDRVDARAADGDDTSTDARTDVDPSSVPTGFPSVDRILGSGLRRGDLIALGGDVGSGKSALALAIAIRASAAGYRVTFATGEMLPERVFERILAVEGRVRIDDVRRATLDETARAGAGAAAVRLRGVVPRVERIGGIRGAAVEALVRLTTEGDEATELLVVDSLQSLGASTRDLAEENANSARELKALALEAHVAILATAQLPLLQPRSDRRPILDDFGAFGAVKHHADVVLALYREGMYDAARDIEGATELLVLKNRHGGTGYVDLYFYKQWMRFEDMLDPDR